MKKIFYIVILLSLSRQFLGQTFKQHKQTGFYFVSADKKLSGSNKTNAYIKKADTILIINKADLTNFLTLFEKSPLSFNSLFQNLPWIGNKNAASDKFDKVLRQTNYKTHADISAITVSEKDGEIIWDIVNSDYVNANPSCYSSIIFRLKSKTVADKTKMDNLDYIKVVSRHCDY